MRISKVVNDVMILRIMSIILVLCGAFITETVLRAKANGSVYNKVLGISIGNRFS